MAFFKGSASEGSLEGRGLVAAAAHLGNIPCGQRSRRHGELSRFECNAWRDSARSDPIANDVGAGVLAVARVCRTGKVQHTAGGAEWPERGRGEVGRKKRLAAMPALEERRDFASVDSASNRVEGPTRAVAGVAKGAVGGGNHRRRGRWR